MLKPALRPGDVSVGSAVPDAVSPFRDAVANWKRTRL